MKCTHCDSADDDLRKYCTHCGAPKCTICKHCGSASQAKDIYCGECGASLDSSHNQNHLQQPHTTKALSGLAGQYAVADIEELLSLRRTTVMVESSGEKLHQDDINKLFDEGNA